MRWLLIGIMAGVIVYLATNGHVIFLHCSFSFPSASFAGVAADGR
jgi:hypothetical protein